MMYCVLFIRSDTFLKIISLRGDFVYRTCPRTGDCRNYKKKNVMKVVFLLLLVCKNEKKRL